MQKSDLQAIQLKNFMSSAEKTENCLNPIKHSIPPLIKYVYSDLHRLKTLFSKRCQDRRLQFGSWKQNEKNNHTPKDISKALRSTKSVQRLTFAFYGLRRNNKITQQEYRYFSEALKSLKSVRFLDYFYLREQDLKHLSKAFKSLYLIESIVLMLSYECITNESAKIMRRGLQCLKRLKDVKLEIEILIKTTTEVLQFISESLKDSKILERLDLSIDQGTYSDMIPSFKGFEYLAERLQCLKCLKRLRLRFRLYSFFDIFLRYLSKSVKSLDSLQDITLTVETYKHISDQGLKFLGECLPSLHSLKRLSLEISARDDAELQKITDKGVESLGSILPSLHSLQNLSIKFSRCPNITDNGLECLSENLKSLFSLQDLTLQFWNCKVTHKGMKCLRESLKFLHSEQKIHLNFKKCIEICGKTVRYCNKGLYL